MFSEFLKEVMNAKLCISTSWRPFLNWPMASNCSLSSPWYRFVITWGMFVILNCWNRLMEILQTNELRAGQTWFYEFSLHCFVKGERWKIAWVLSWTGCSSSSRSTSCEFVEEESNSPIATTALSFCVFKLLIKIEKYDCQKYPSWYFRINNFILLRIPVTLIE